jgi:transcriptional regulator of arginine metabolism
MSRAARQIKILELIGKQEIDKQEDLARLLNSEGFSVTQATVSRDIKEMGIIKMLSPSGKYRYALQSKDDGTIDKYHSLFKTSVLSINSSENIIVVKTEAGGASSAAALIDRINFEGVLGTVSGDDTIFIVTSTKEITPQIVEKFKRLLD